MKKSIFRAAESAAEDEGRGRAINFSKTAAQPGESFAASQSSFHNSRQLFLPR